MSCFHQVAFIPSHAQTNEEVTLKNTQEIHQEVPLQVEVSTPVPQKVKEEQTLTFFLQTSLFCTTMCKRRTEDLFVENGWCCMGFHPVYRRDGATAVLYCKKRKKANVFVSIVQHLQMEFIQTVDHTSKECEDESYIHAVNLFL